MSGYANSENKSYRKLLIFVLVFQAILSTAWIMYDNYGNYQENPSQISMSSLVASTTGLIIVLLVWWLLNSAEKEARITSNLKESSKEESKNVSDSQTTVSTVTANTQIASETLLWQYNSDENTFITIGEQIEQRINFPESTSLLQNFENTDFISSSDSDLFNNISSFNEKTVLAFKIVEKNDTIGMLTFYKPSDTVWETQEIDKARSLSSIYSNQLVAKNATDKLHEFEEQEQLWLEASDDADLAIAFIKLPYPVSSIEIDQAILKMAKITYSNTSYRNLFEGNNLVSILSDDALSNLRNTAKTEFELNKITDGTTSNLKINIKPIYKDAQVDVLVFRATVSETLDETKGIHHQLIEQSEDLFLAVDSDNIIQFVSTNTESFFRIPSNEEKSFNILSFVPQDYYEKLSGVLQQVKDERIRQHLHAIPFRNYHGETTKFDVVLYPIVLPKNDITIAIELRVIQERLELAASMEKKNQLLADLLNLTDEVVTVVDSKGNIQFVSDNMHKHFGYNKENRLGSYVFDFIAPQFTEAIHDDFEKVKNFPTLQSTRKISYLKQDGNWEPVVVKQANLIENPLVNGIVVKFSKNGHSNTYKKEMEDLHLAKGLLENQSQPTVLLDKHGEILSSNNLMVKYLGYLKDELVQKSWFDLLPEKAQNTVKSNLAYLEKTPNDTLNSLIYLKNKKGGWQEVDTTTKAVINQGELIGYYITLQEEQKTNKQHKASDTEFRAKFYNALLTGVESILVFADYDANIKYVNSVGKTLLGYQLKGNINDRIHSHGHYILQKALEKINNQDSASKKLKTQIINKEGNWVDCQISIKNALTFSSFKGAFLEIILLEKSQPKPKSTEKHEQVAVSWLNQQKETGIAFLLKNGKMIYKNAVFEELLGREVMRSIDIQQAIQEQDSLQQLYKQTLATPEKIHKAFFHNLQGEKLSFSFNSISKKESDNDLVFVLQITKELENANSTEKVLPPENKSTEVSKPISQTEGEAPLDESHHSAPDEEELITLKKETNYEASPKLLENFKGEPELVNANDVLDTVITEYKGQLAQPLSIVKQFKNDAWIFCKEDFLYQVFKTVFVILQGGNLERAGKIMITSQKADKSIRISISENFSDNQLKKETEGFLSGEVGEGPVKDLYNFGQILEAFEGKIKIHNETSQGVSININLPTKIGIAY